MQPLSDIQSFQHSAASEQPAAQEKVTRRGHRTVNTITSTNSGYETLKGTPPPSGGDSTAYYTPKNLQEFLISFLQEEHNLPVFILLIPHFNINN
jgi:hypothetical protein